VSNPNIPEWAVTSSTLYGINDPKHPANVFVRTVAEHVGSNGHSWVISNSSAGSGDAWCAYTVMATAKVSGYAGVVLPKSGDKVAGWVGSGETFSLGNPGGVAIVTIKLYNGVRFNGPYWGRKNVIPSAGDLIIFAWKGGDIYNKARSAYKNGTQWRYYSSDHIGIVEYFKDGKVHTIEGNNGGSLRRSSYDQNCESIAYYVRPDWTKANGVKIQPTSGITSTMGEVNPNGTVSIEYTVEADNGMYTTALYTTESTRIDASVREIGYLDSKGNPTTSKTGIRLAAINYTPLLNSMYKTLFGGGSAGLGSPDNIDGLDSIPRTIVQYFKDKGLVTSAAIGIIANIEAESSFRTSCVGDGGTSFGICQWHNARGTSMKNYVGANWANNLSGQLDYLWYDMTTNYSSMVEFFKTVPNTLAGAQDSAEKFVRVFERPLDLSGAVTRRRAAAEKFWGKIVTVSTTPSVTGSGVPVTASPGVQIAQTGYGNVYLRWPISSVTPGTYTSGYGPRNVNVAGATKYHNGVDIGASSGTPIICCASGTVCKNFSTGARGWVIVVDHGNTFYTLYQHMKSQSTLTVGTKVTNTTVLGYVGNTGLEGMGAHLHLEIHKGALLQGTGSGENYRSTSTVNPEAYFPSKGSTA
jgi:murein DD-endopeptidase MepM/ murein hydrolase activator NlpD